MKVITYDIEVSPRIGYFYGSNWEPKLVKEIKGQQLLSFAWKELGKKKAHIIANEPQKVMLKKIWSVFNDSDILISYNGDKFDKRMMNAYFLREGITPPSPSHSIDLLKIVRKNFSFPSNSLNNVLKELGMEGKMETNFDDWEGCMNGCQKSWGRMIKYNKLDVVRTEELFYKLRPWIENINIADVPDGCPICGSYNFQKRGQRKNKMGTVVRQEFKCNDCNKWFHTKTGGKTDTLFK